MKMKCDQLRAAIATIVVLACIGSAQDEPKSGDLYIIMQDNRNVWGIPGPGRPCEYQFLSYAPGSSDSNKIFLEPSGAHFPPILWKARKDPGSGKIFSFSTANRTKALKLAYSKNNCTDEKSYLSSNGGTAWSLVLYRQNFLPYRLYATDRNCTGKVKEMLTPYATKPGTSCSPPNTSIVFRKPVKYPSPEYGIGWSFYQFYSYPAALYGDLKPVGVSNDVFGRALDLRGNRIVIGQENPAAAWIFVKKGSEWGRWVRSKLKRPSAASNNDFGVSVGAGSEFVAIGSPASLSNSTGLGTVYIYRAQASVSWDKIIPAALPRPAGATRYFGASLSVSDNAIAVADVDLGNVFIYRLGSDGQWSGQQAVLKSDSPGFGSSVSLDGNTLAVSGLNKLYVYIWENNGSADGWTQQAALTSTPPAQVPELVTLNGDTLGTGIRSFSPQGYKPKIFTRIGKTWSLTQELNYTSLGVVPGPDNWIVNFGVRAIQGDILIVGIRYDIHYPEEYGMKCWVLKKSNSTGLWEKKTELKPPGRKKLSWHNLGNVASISGDLIVVSAPGFSGLSQYTAEISGKVYIWDQNLL